MVSVIPLTDEQRKKTPDVVHRIVRTHPRTRKKISTSMKVTGWPLLIWTEPRATRCSPSCSLISTIWPSSIGTNGTPGNLWSSITVPQCIVPWPGTRIQCVSCGWLSVAPTRRCWQLLALHMPRISTVDNNKMVAPVVVRMISSSYFRHAFTPENCSLIFLLRSLHTCSCAFR